MNQVAFSTVILRLIGFYLIFKLIIDLSMAAVVHQGWSFGEAESTIPAWLIAALVLRCVLGLALVLFAPSISRLLFDEGENVISAGQIDGTALLQVGLSLLGFYFLIQYLPALAQFSIDWFRAQAADVPPPQPAYGPFHGWIEVVAMTILSLLLIFRSKSLGSWVDRVSR